MLLALGISTFYACREHLTARRLAAQLQAQQKRLDGLAAQGKRQTSSLTAASPRAPATVPDAQRVASDTIAVVPPISPRAFDTKDDVEDLLDIQRFFVPTLMELGLSGEQVAEVRSLMLQARQSSRDAAQIAHEHGWRSGGIAEKAIEDAVTQFYPKIRAAVGDAHFRQVQTMLADASEFRRVEFAIEPHAELLGQPLSADQKLVLTRAIAKVSRRPGILHPAVDPQTGLTPSDQQIIARASGALSAAQVAMLRQYFARQRLSAAQFPGVASQIKN